MTAVFQIDRGAESAPLSTLRARRPGVSSNLTARQARLADVKAKRAIARAADDAGKDAAKKARLATRKAERLRKRQALATRRAGNLLQKGKLDRAKRQLKKATKAGADAAAQEEHAVPLHLTAAHLQATAAEAGTIAGEARLQRREGDRADAETHALERVQGHTDAALTHADLVAEQQRQKMKYGFHTQSGNEPGFLHKLTGRSWRRGFKRGGRSTRRRRTKRRRRRSKHRRRRTKRRRTKRRRRRRRTRR